MIVHDDGTSSNDDRLGAIGDIRFAVEQGRPARRRSARDRGGQSLRVLARRLRRVLARARAAAARSPSTGSPIPSLASLYGVVELDADDRVVGARGEARASAQRPRLDRHLSLLARAPRAARALPRRRATRPIRPGSSSPGSTSASRSTASASPRSGSTSAITASCSRPTIATARGPACRRGTSYVPGWRSERAFDTELTQTRHGFAPYRDAGWLLELVSCLRAASFCSRSGAACLRRAARRSRARAGSLAPLCARCGAPTDVAGRALPRVRRPPARVRARPARRSATGLGPRRSCARGRSAGSARSRPSPPSSSSGTCRGRRQTSSPISRLTATGSLRRGHHPARRLARELGARWEHRGRDRCSAGRA